MEHGTPISQLGGVSKVGREPEYRLVAIAIRRMAKKKRGGASNSWRKKRRAGELLTPSERKKQWLMTQEIKQAQNGGLQGPPMEYR